MALLSLLILVFLLILSLFSRINVGWLGIVASIILAKLAHIESPSLVLQRFPSELFLTLLSVCYFFSIVDSNGTLEKLFQYFQRLTRGSVRILPWVFFVFTWAIAAIGAGNIAAAALTAPLAMLTSRKYGLSPLLMALMVGNGANAGALSPLAPAGIVFSIKLKESLLEVDTWKVFVLSLLVHFLVSVAAYFMFKGHRARGAIERSDEPKSFDSEQIVTLALLALMIATVIGFKVHIAPLAIALAALLTLLFPKHHYEKINNLPWNTLIMICGLSLLVGMIETLGGIELLASWLESHVSLRWMPGGLAMLSGFASSFSSSTAVVLPSFIPLIPQLISESTGPLVLSLSASIAIGAHLVDVSPLSTIGALCIAAVPEGSQRNALYKQMLTWGMAMILGGAIICQLLFSL